MSGNPDNKSLFGFLNIYKPVGMTSHDVVSVLRRVTKIKQIGHTGTLDPFAEGVLPICIGKATRLIEYLQDDKEYLATVQFGAATNTFDLDGEKVFTSDKKVSRDDIKEGLKSFEGEILQFPPIFSAIKVNGKKLYELARQGVEIERKPRRVEIHHIKIEEINLPRVTFSVGCSKGTYIRTLCADIGDRLGCGALMETLQRTRVGNFHIEQALKLSQIEELVRENRLEEYVIAPDAVFEEYESLTVMPEFDKVLLNGNKLYFKQVRAVRKRFEDGEWTRVYASNGTFTGVYTYCEQEHCFKPYKMFL